MHDSGEVENVSTNAFVYLKIKTKYLYCICDILQ